MLEKLLDHIDDIVAAVVVLGGILAIACGRDSYMTALVGTAMGYLFKSGVARARKRS